MKVYIILLLMFLSGLVNGQGALDLSKAISIGLENNFGIKVNDQFIQIAQNNNTWARAGKLPTIDLTANFNNTITSDNNPASFLRGEFYNGSISGGLNGQWTIFSGGRVKIVKEQLMLAIDQQKLNKQSDIHELLRTIYQQYFDILFQQERLIAFQSSLNLSKSRLSYEKTKRSYGASNSFNIIQFENAVFVDSTNLINQSQRINISKRSLYNTLNIPGFPNYQFNERLSIGDEEIDVDKLKTILSEENYTLKSLDMIASLNRLNSQIEESRMMPNISANASVSVAENGFKIFAENPNTGQPYDFLLSNRINGNAGITASWNLFDGGVKKTNIQNALLQEEINQINMLEAKAKLSNQLDILADNFNNQKVLLNLSNEQILLAQRNLEISEERFKSGQISSIDFRNVQNQYINAAFGKVNAIYNLIISKSEIDYLVGKYSNN